MIIIFIRSEYQKQEQEEEQEEKKIQESEKSWTKTHESKKKCCHGENGDLIGPISEMISQNDIVITKNYYSCFTHTQLDRILKENNINDVFICGLTLANCVSQSALHAAHLGYNVILVKSIIMQRHGDKDIK